MKYPIYKNEKDKLRLPSGRSVASFSLESLENGDLGPGDLGIDEDMLRAQAQIAAEAGFHQVAANLRRAAEMTKIPDEEILEMYDALRPGRSSAERLEVLAERAETVYGASLTAAFLREAAAVSRAHRED